jgi:hypothetical protein
VKTAEHVVAACGKALIKERLAVNALIVPIGETGLLDHENPEVRIQEEKL